MSKPVIIDIATGQKWQSLDVPGKAYKGDVFIYRPPEGINTESDKAGWAGRFDGNTLTLGIDKRDGSISVLLGGPRRPDRAIKIITDEIDVNVDFRSPKLLAGNFTFVYDKDGGFEEMVPLTHFADKVKQNNEAVNEGKQPPHKLPTRVSWWRLPEDDPSLYDHYIRYVNAAYSGPTEILKTYAFPLKSAGGVIAEQLVGDSYLASQFKNNVVGSPGFVDACDVLIPLLKGQLQNDSLLWPFGVHYQDEMFKTDPGQTAFDSNATQARIWTDADVDMPTPKELMKMAGNEQVYDHGRGTVIEHKLATGRAHRVVVPEGHGQIILFTSDVQNVGFNWPDHTRVDGIAIAIHQEGRPANPIVYYGKPRNIALMESTELPFALVRGIGMTAESNGCDFCERQKQGCSGDSCSPGAPRVSQRRYGEGLIDLKQLVERRVGQPGSAAKPTGGAGNPGRDVGGQ